MKKDCFFKYVFITLLYVCGFNEGTNAQNSRNNDVPGVASNVPSPYASNLGECGLVPVSPYTGKASVNIPIYSTSVRDVNLDVYLDYNTSGLLANNLPGWTGHGWTLMAGGAITRKVNNHPDELSYKGTNAGYNYYDEGNRSEIERCKSFTNYFANASKIKNAQSYDFFSAEAEGKADYSADVFYFDFLGIHGSFFYGNDGNWKVACDRNIAVIFDVNNSSNYIQNYEKYYTGTDIEQPKMIKGFTLIDDAGNKYIFGGNQSSIEYVTDVMLRHKCNTTSPWIASTWMLTEVQDRFGNVLYKFKYSRGKEFVQLYNSFSNMSVDGYSVNVYSAISGSLNAPVYLDEIRTLNGHVICLEHDVLANISYKTLYPSFGEFSDKNWQNMLKSTYPAYDESKFKSFFDKNVMQGEKDLESMRLEKLNRIFVYNLGNGTQTRHKITEIALNYSFDKRMHLVSVSQGDGMTKSKEYKLEYYNYDKLPSDYLTTSIDYWGYYNGKSKDLNNQSLPSKVYTRSSWSASDPKQPNFESSRYGMLKKLINPTGGYTVLEYEQNTYRKYIDDDRSTVKQTQEDIPAGGLRIKSVTSWDDGEIIAQKTYLYKRKDGASTGELSSKPNCSYNFSKGKVSVRVENTCSMFPLSNTFSCVVGYSYVKEENLDHSSTEYEFYNYSDEMDEKYDLTMDGLKFPNPFVEFSSRSYMCGTLKAKANYGKNFNTLTRSEYTYMSDDEFNKKNYVSTTCYTVLNGKYNRVYIGGRYKLFYPKVKIKTSRDITYMPGTREVVRFTNNDYRYTNLSFTDSQKRYYVDVLQLLKTATTDEYNTMTTQYEYTNQGNDMCKLLANKFFLAPVATKRYYDSRLVGGSKVVYGKCNDEFVPIYDIRFGKNENVCDTVASYISYTKTYRPTEYIDGSGMNHKLFWDYYDRQIASVDNSSSNLFPNAVLESKDMFALCHSKEVFGTKPVNANVTVYNTKGLVDNVTSGNKQSVYYKYNTWSDVSCILDNDKKVVQAMQYNYSSSDDASNGATSEPAFEVILDSDCKVAENYIKDAQYDTNKKKINVTVMTQSVGKSCKIHSHIYSPSNPELGGMITSFKSGNGLQTIEVEVSKIKYMFEDSAVRTIEEEENPNQNRVNYWDIALDLYVDNKKVDTKCISIVYVQETKKNNEGGKFNEREK